MSFKVLLVAAALFVFLGIFNKLPHHKSVKYGGMYVDIPVTRPGLAWLFFFLALVSASAAFLLH